MNHIRLFLSKCINNDYIFSVITKIISVVLVLAYSIIFNRYMHAELLGVRTVISNYSELIMLVLSFGIYQAYPFYKKQGRDNVYDEFINLTIGVFTLYLIIAIVLICLLNASLQLKTIIIIIPFMFLTRTLNYVVIIENPKIRNITQVLLDIFDILFVTILSLLFRASLKICIMFIIIREIAFACVAYINLRYDLRKLRPSLKNFIPYVKFGIIPMLTIILMEVNYKADVIMMKHMNITSTEIGIYSLAVTLGQKIWLIPDALKDILLSNLAKGKSEQEVAKVNRISLTIVFVFIIMMILVGKPIIGFLYGEEFLKSYSVLLILLIGVIGMIFYKMIYAYNVVHGKRALNFVLLLIAAIVNIALNLIVIPQYGIEGAALASTASYFICGMSFLGIFCHQTHISLNKMIIINKTDCKMLISFVKGRDN